MKVGHTVSLQSPFVPYLSTLGKALQGGKKSQIVWRPTYGKSLGTLRQ